MRQVIPTPVIQTFSQIQKLKENYELLKGEFVQRGGNVEDFREFEKALYDLEKAWDDLYDSTLPSTFK